MQRSTLKAAAALWPDLEHQLSLPVLSPSEYAGLHQHEYRHSCDATLAARMKANVPGSPTKRRDPCLQRQEERRSPARTSHESRVRWIDAGGASRKASKTGSRSRASSLREAYKDAFGGNG